ncbi:hypothetical protein AB6C93_24695 [Vibrio splendidus]
MLDLLKLMFEFLIKCVLGFIKFLVFIVIVTVAWDFFDSKKDEWIGFVYPDRNNLWNDRNVGTFSTLEECRNVAADALLAMGANYSGDYECALNCNTSGGKPYVCKETSR